MPGHYLHLIDKLPVMVGYWNASERCLYSNAAYEAWFGQTQQGMEGIEKRTLLGPSYEENAAHIRGALAGERQTFERTMQRADGSVLQCVANYEPDRSNGVVIGFLSHVADVSAICSREQQVREALRDAIRVLEKTKHSFRSKELGALRTRLEDLAGN